MQNDRIIMIVLLVVGVILLLVLLWAIFKKFIKNMTWSSAIICVIILLAIIGTLAYFLFAPRGTDSIFSSSVDGREQGDTTVNTGVAGKKDIGTEFNIDKALEGNADGDNIVYVNICGEKITIGEHEFEDIDSFGEGMKSINEDAQGVCLVDDYAQADTFRAAQEKLEQLGIDYSQIQNE